MLLAAKYEIAGPDQNPIEKVLEVFEKPEDFDGQTIFFTWKEEALFDSIAGMIWPLYLAELIKDKYRERGEKTEGFNAEISFPEDSEGCLVTFVQR